MFQPAYGTIVTTAWRQAALGTQQIIFQTQYQVFPITSRNVPVMRCSQRLLNCLRKRPDFLAHLVTS